MTTADFSTRIDVQPPQPALLPVIGDAVSERFADGISNYQDRLEQSLSQTPSVVATSRRAAQAQRTSGSQQQTLPVAANATSSARVAIKSRRADSQFAPQTQRRRPASQTSTSATAKPLPRPAPTADRSFSPSSSAEDKSPAADETATPSGAGVAPSAARSAETASTGTATQNIASTETAPAAGTPPVDLQLFTTAEVAAKSLLAGGRQSEIDGVAGPALSQSGEGPDGAAGESDDRPDNNILVPPTGMFVTPNLTQAATKPSEDTVAAPNQTSRTESLSGNAQTDAPLSTAGDSQSGGEKSAADAPDSEQVSSMPAPAVIATRQGQVDVSDQLTVVAGPGPDGIASADSTSTQPAGTNAADVRSAGPANDATADGNSPTPRTETSVAVARSTEAVSSAGFRNGTDSKTRRRGDDGSKTGGPQATGTAPAKTDNPSGPATQTRAANRTIVAANPPLVSTQPTPTETGTSVPESQKIDAGGPTNGDQRSTVGNPGTATASTRTAGPARATNGSQGGRATELVDRVATAVRSAHQSQRELRIRLTPPELGTVKIEILSRGGVLNARLEVETAAAQQTIQHSLSLLRDTLAQQGTHLQRIDVHLAPNRNEEGQPQSGGQQQPGSQHQERQQQQQPHHGSQEPQRTKDEESSGRPQSFRSLDELDIQV